MKFFFAMMVFVVFFPVIGQAETGEQVCRSITVWEGQRQCLNMIANRYVDQDAGRVCIRARVNEARFDCLRFSLDKEYTVDDALICDRMLRDLDRVECMRYYGTPVDDSRSRARLDAIKNRAIEGMDFIQRGLYQEAYESLRRIRELTDNK